MSQATIGDGAEVADVRKAQACRCSGSPRTLAAAPQVVDLLDARPDPEAAPWVAPPPRDYCGVEWLAGPADADADGLPEAHDVVGASLLTERLRARVVTACAPGTPACP